MDSEHRDFSPGRISIVLWILTILGSAAASLLFGLWGLIVLVVFLPLLTVSTIRDARAQRVPFFSMRRRRRH